MTNPYLDFNALGKQLADIVLSADPNDLTVPGRVYAAIMGFVCQRRGTPYEPPPQPERPDSTGYDERSFDAGFKAGYVTRQGEIERAWTHALCALKQASIAADYDVSRAALAQLSDDLEKGRTPVH